MPTFENYMPAPFTVPPAQQHVMVPPPMQAAAQNYGMMMLPGSDPTLYTTAVGQDLVGAVPGDAAARQPLIRKLFDPHSMPDDAGMRQAPEYYVNAHHTYSDHTERSAEPRHARRESDSGVLHPQEVAASVQGARLQSSNLTPQGSPVMQHKQAHGKPTSATSLAGFAPTMQPRVLPGHNYMMAQHPMSAYTPQQLQQIQLLQQQQYVQHMAASALPQVPQPQQKPQFIPQPQLRGQLMDSNALANYMASQQYQQMAMSGGVPPPWMYVPPSGQPNFTAGVAPTYVQHANPAPAAHPVIAQSAPMIPVAQPAAVAPPSVVPHVTSAS